MCAQVSGRAGFDLSGVDSHVFAAPSELDLVDVPITSKTQQRWARAKVRIAVHTVRKQPRNGAHLGRPQCHRWHLRHQGTFSHVNVLALCRGKEATWDRVPHFAARATTPCKCDNRHTCDCNNPHHARAPASACNNRPTMYTDTMTCTMPKTVYVFWLCCGLCLSPACMCTGRWGARRSTQARRR